MNWCKNNCESEWYNDIEDYSSIVFIDPKEALKFALVWSNFTEEQKVIAILRWSVSILKSQESMKINRVNSIHQIP